MKIIMLLLFLALLSIACDQDPITCNGVKCSDKGRCIKEGNGVTCECNPGYHAEGLECISTKCDPDCKEGENCVVKGNDVVCECGIGYHIEKGICTKNPTKCDHECADGEECKNTAENVFVCLCKDNYRKVENGCIFYCDNKNSIINSTNDGCDCKTGFYEENGKCLPKIGCHADNTNCGQGTCKEDLEKDFYCDCNEGYFFNGTTCKEIACHNQILCGTTCCENNQICMRGECTNLGIDCHKDIDCELNEFCDPIINKCLEVDKDDNNGCFYQSGNLGNLTPLTVWDWPNRNTSFQDYKHVIMTPVITNLTDDNNDGNIDLKDIPDIAFVSYKKGAEEQHEGYHYGYLRIIDGKTGADIATKTSPTLDGGAAIATAKINGKTLLIAMQSDRRKLLAFSYNDDDGIVLEWIQDTIIDHETGYINEGMPAIADLDHDGKAEIIIGNYILDMATGVEICHSTSDLLSYGNNSDWAIDSNASRQHTNRRYATIIEDTNGDGVMDIITGNQFFSGVDCSSLVKRDDRHDGFTAIADLNNDSTPEVVVISNGWLYIYDKMTMSDLITPLQLDVEDLSDWAKYPIGGSPTIANFDDDDNLEIAVAGKFAYKVIDVDLALHTATVKWEKETKDKSSRETGSSLFDFEGDGRAEVLYADECYFRIYDGETGEERFKIKNSSGTILEYPLVVDLDNDGKSEVLLVANASESNICDWGTHADDGNAGIRVFEDTENRWVRTRRIWNQHSYHITNIEEDGTLPTTEKHNWETYNNYRLNSQGKGVFNAPDLEITRVDVKRIDCPKLTFKFNITILNRGSVSVASDLPVSIYQGEKNNSNFLGVVKTTKYLKPGEQQELKFSYSPENPDNIYKIFIAADDRGNGHGEYQECNENNNNYPLSFKGSYRLYCQAGIGECMRFAPYKCNENNQLICSAKPGKPIDEICNDGFDNNCDGEIDEGCGCNAQDVQDCYKGSSSLLVDNSRCKTGSMTCIAGEFWNSCTEDILPIPEKCNGIDDDCDGEIDENFQVGSSCNIGLGICKRNGHFKCDNLGNQICDVTAGDPVFEICNNNLDDNCNGQKDERPCRD